MAVVGAIAGLLFSTLPAAAFSPSRAYRGAPDARCDRGDGIEPCAMGVLRGANSPLFIGKAGSGVDASPEPVRLDPTAQPPETAPSAAFLACMDHAGGTTSAMLDCGRAEIARVDTRLNAAYHQLMTTLPAADAVRLRASQRAWLRRHLAKTRRLAGAPDNGSLAFIDSQRFELQDLGERTILLERMLAAHR